jgi:CubicO group peptidase (beta-lactamase class C family)
VPSEAADVAAESFTELGLVGLIVAGEMWVHTRGWANLYRKQELLPEHRFPASAISMLVTATAVLRLVADGRVGLDEPANRYLRAIRLAGGAVTVRELLSHTDGVDDPEARFADRVPDLVSVTGRIASASGGRRCCPARWPARR